MLKKPTLADVPAISALIEGYADKGGMLHRPAAEICDRLRDFFVYDADGVIAGTCALHICSNDLAEIRSLAVAEGYTRRGIGGKLVKACMDEARSIGIKKVFALTYQTRFFKRLGFKATDKEALPHKIWQDCIRCVKFPSCDENAVLLEIKDVRLGAKRKAGGGRVETRGRRKKGR